MPESRLEKVLALLRGALIEAAVVQQEFGKDWIGFMLRLRSGEELTLVVSTDEEGNGPGALLGLWEFARAKGI